LAIFFIYDEVRSLGSFRFGLFFVVWMTFFCRFFFVWL